MGVPPGSRNSEVPPSFLGGQETGFYTTIGTRPESAVHAFHDAMAVALAP
jgi:hypothetical protein